VSYDELVRETNALNETVAARTEPRRQSLASNILLFPYLSHEHQTVVVHVRSHLRVVSGVAVSVEQTGCHFRSSTKLETGLDGTVALTLPLRTDYSPYTTVLTLSHPEYVQASVPLHVGGLPFVTERHEYFTLVTDAPKDTGVELMINTFNA
jgi:hypothetical protein